MDDKSIGKCQDQLREVNKLMFHSEDKNTKKVIYLLTDVIQNIGKNIFKEDEMSIDELAREVIEYFDTHILDQKGLELYLKAEKILENIQVIPIDKK